jgi:carboxymethylenebutenolidase
MNSSAEFLDADLGAVFDAHMQAEFVTCNLDATTATMTDTPHLIHVPVMTGGYGREEIRQFYGRYFIGHWPADTKIRPISRTIGQQRLVDEFIVSFTHDVEMPALLPGVAPTGQKVELPHVAVVGFTDGKVAYEHIYWDQASLLVQIGLLDPVRLPVSGVQQARKLLDPRLPSNQLIVAQRAKPVKCNDSLGTKGALHGRSGVHVQRAHRAHQGAVAQGVSAGRAPAGDVQRTRWYRQALRN